MNLIKTTEELSAVCGDLAKQEFIAIDTEFMRETTYWPKLCLIQIAAGDTEIIIDPLAEGIDLSPLFTILLDEKILKVFHAPRQDLEIFYRIMGKVLPKPVFDTQTAAMALGLGEQVSYDGLISALLGIHVDKTHRFTDWALRPLSQNQLNYAIADVTHLRDAYPIIVEKLEQLERMTWVAEEMQFFSNPVLYDTTPTNAWKRLKPKKFNTEYMAAFFAAATWREWYAQEKDIPRGRTLKDDAIFEIAEQKPRTPEAMDKMRAIPKGFGKSKGGMALLEALNEAMEAPEDFAPKASRPKPNPSGIGAITELLKVLLRAVSEDLGVAPRLIASTNDLEAIAISDDADTPALQGWRREIFGEKALKLKHGEFGLAIKGKKVTISELQKIIAE
jgi:ribonuclease D